MTTTTNQETDENHVRPGFRWHATTANAYWIVVQCWRMFDRVDRVSQQPTFMQWWRKKELDCGGFLKDGSKDIREKESFTDNVMSKTLHIARDDAKKSQLFWGKNPDPLFVAREH